MPHQEAFAVVAKIKPGNVEAVKNVLGTIEGHRGAWDIIPFARLTNLHFARLVVFDATTDLDNNDVPAQLAMMTNVDAPVAGHIRDLTTLCGPGLDEVFGHCEAYPELSQRTPERRAAFLEQHRSEASAFYVNRQGRTVKQIRQEDDLRYAIDDYLDSSDSAQQSPESIRDSIIGFVRSRPELQWALSPAEVPELLWRVKESIHGIVTVIAVVLLSPLLLLLLPIFVVLLRYHETKDQPDESRASLDAIRDFRADEDFLVQNQIIAVGLFKPGWFRWLTARMILRAADYACRHIYNTGSLSGLNTIHFARWVPIDGGRRLFFASNYDGSLESYMSDFIDKAAWDLNAIFSSGDGFPKTAFLFCLGITDEIAYKRFLPTRQVRSRVWYSAYPHLTTKNIANNQEIRKGLSAALDADEVRAWLRRFGAGNQLPRAGVVARLIDRIRWDRICRCCK